MKYTIGFAVSLLVTALVVKPSEALALKAESSPAIMGNTLYIGADDGTLFAYDLTSYSLKWTYLTQGAIISSPSIASDGTAYFGSSDGYVYAINSNGTKKWRFAIGHAIESSPAIGSDGTIYIGSQDASSHGYLFAINSNGTEKWRFSVGSYVSVVSSPVIGIDGSVLIVDGNVPAILHAVDPDSGTQRWERSLGLGSLTNPRTSPCLASDGTIYVAFTGGNGGVEGGMLAIYSTGIVKWAVLLSNDSAFQYVHSSPSLAPDGTVLFTGEADDGNEYFFALDPMTGAQKWKYHFPIPERSGGGTPCVDVNGVAYLNNGRLRAITPDGQELWRTAAGSANDSSPILGGDGSIYYRSGGDWQLFNFVDAGSPAASTWSTYRGNARHTANFWDVYAQNDVLSPVYRFWSNKFGAHFYIMGDSERDRIAAKYPGIWRYETVAWYAYPTQAAGTQPVHRFWSDQLGKHFYIMGDSERDRIAAKYQGIWRYETVAWYAYPTQVVGTQPVGRFWSDQFMGHFYTITQAEINRIAAKYPGIWNYETVAYWAFLTPPAGMQAVAASVPSTSGLDALSSTNPGETLTPEEGEATVGTDETANGVVFPLAVAGARVSAFVYDATADKPTQILDGADSPGEAVFSGVEPDRDYRFEVWQDGAGSKKAVLVHASSFERRLDPPATLADAADASDGGDGVVGAPAARILTPAAEGTLTLKLYSAAAGVVETRGDVAGGETVDFSLPVWNRWYWVGGWRDADGELVLSLWLRHELETGN